MLPIKNKLTRAFLALGMAVQIPATCWGVCCVGTEGNVIVEHLDMGGKLIKQSSYSAPVSIKLASDGRFISKIYNHSFYKTNEIIFSHDGANFFYVISGETNQPQKKAGLGYLSAESMPILLYEDTVRDALWYCLLSGPHFSARAGTGETIQLFYQPRFNPMAYGFRYEAILTNIVFPMVFQLGVWKEKEFEKAAARGAERIELDAKNVGSQLWLDQLEVRSACINGAISLKAEWTSAHQLDGSYFPATVQLTDFYLFRTNPLPRLRIRMDFKPWYPLSIENETFRPDPHQKIAVLDARVRLRDGDRYVDDLSYMIGTSSTNSEWMSTNSPYLQQGINALHRTQTVPSSHPQSLRRFTLICLGVMTLLVPIALWIYFRSRPELKVSVRQSHAGESQAALGWRSVARLAG